MRRLETRDLRAFVLGMAAGALLLLAVQRADAAPALPQDPFLRCATKALRGDYGKLKPWQRRGYAYGLKHRVTCWGKAWTTSYYPAEGFYRGKPTRSGIGVSERSAAICSSKWRTHRGRYVWTQAYGIRVIEDTGADNNQRVARRKGCRLWLDYWYPRNHPANPITPFVIFGQWKRGAM